MFKHSFFGLLAFVASVACESQTGMLNNVLGGPSGNYSTFLSLFNSSGWAPVYDAMNGTTLIAPDNNAFSALSPVLLSLLETSAFSSIAFSVLGYHVIPQIATPTNVYPTELNGTFILVWDNRNGSFVNQAKLLLNSTVSPGNLVYGVDTVVSPTFPFVAINSTQLGGTGPQGRFGRQIGMSAKALKSYFGL